MAGTERKVQKAYWKKKNKAEMKQQLLGKTADIDWFR